MVNKCKVGDKVKIINYGHNIWYEKGGNYFIEDIANTLVGQIGIVAKSEKTQGIPTYALDGIEGKHAWYNEDQLELIKNK